MRTAPPARRGALYRIPHGPLVHRVQPSVFLRSRELLDCNTSLIGFGDGILRLRGRHYTLQREAPASAIKLDAQASRAAAPTRDGPANYCAAARSRGAVRVRLMGCSLP